ncbi:relaxase/mobilization nuclease domain-containing protein [Chitinophaga varians]|uniref:Relaxase/mobilization nuclease domain-containing protein n=1 Tax=Chitinophaga varians TaxID=2202339 RepID=A0A847RZC3_9BACT|nr:relaxase/mobilization nuclease domain-containing protein [Chitinophaga varians]NLR68483.1 relaxase/mobilization nuclease domain-containing protein [Chitinophaga varians]
MVAKIVCGKSIRKALYYNEHKVGLGDAVLLHSGGYLQDTATISFKQKLQRFTDLTRLNERTKTNAVHISLNFSPADMLDADRLRSIADEYLQLIGWGEQPFLLYQHMDAGHPHVHIVTTNINRYGERIETHNIGRIQSERARKHIEESFGLVKAEDQKKEPYTSLQPIDINQVSYGKQPTKAAISRVVREVVATYKFSSFQEFNALLSQFNVYADRGKENSLMYRNGGIQYRLLDDHGSIAGVPIKASSIFTSPTLVNLEKLYPGYKMERKPYGERIKHLVSKALITATTMESLQQQLREKGIRLLLYRNTEGKVYGMSLIDNATRCIFKASDLGKDFSAAKVMEKLESFGGTDQNTADNQPPKFTKEQAPTQFPAQAAAVFFSLWDDLTSDEHTESSTGTLRRKRKILGL